MNNSRFKYFSKIEYAHSFLQGKLFHQTLGYFRDYEDTLAKQIIGDEFEATRIFRPTNGLVVNNLTQGISTTLDMGFEASVRAGEIYVLCMSHSLTHEQIREFKAVACVEILNPKEFIQRWINALPPNAKYLAERVKYYKLTDEPENVWAQPELITTTKLAQFAYQDEYRLAFSTTGALDFNNCAQKLVDRKMRPAPQISDHHSMTLDVGNIDDICKLHEF